MSEPLASRFQTLHEFVKAARTNLNRNVWDYLIGGAETETTVARNRMALDALAFRPRVLNDVSEIDCSGSLFGRKLRIPVLCAPVGSLEAFEPGGGATVAKAAAAIGTGMILSSVSHPGLEATAAAAGDGFKIFQLYVRGDAAWVDDHFRRAIDAGYDAFCLTVDTDYYSRRERDIAKRHQRGRRDPEGQLWQARQNWRDVERYKAKFDIPLILKGIATAEDAERAVGLGVDCVYVSNHGGRQLDHALGSIDVLPEIVAAVGGRARIIVDGGISRGTDVVKAMILGADAVAVGRLYVYGLAAAGGAGIVRLFEILEHEIRICLGLLGVTGFAGLDGSYLAPARPVMPAHVHSAFPHLDLPRERYRSGRPDPAAGLPRPWGYPGAAGGRSAVVLPVLAPQEIGSELIEARAADLAHDEIDLVLQDRDRLGGAGHAADDRAVQRRPAEKYEARPEAQRDQDVGVAAHAAVEHDGQPVAERGVNGRQDVERGRRLVELAAAMVRDDDAVDADLGGAQGVGRMHDAFDDQRAREQLAVAFEVAPSLGVRRHLVSGEGNGLFLAGAVRRVGRPVVEGGGAARAQIFDDPGGMRHRLQQDPRLQLQRFAHAAPAHGAKTVADVALALRMDRHVDGQHQRVEPGVARPAHEIVGDVHVARGVELIPGVVRRHPRRRLHRGVAHARHDEGDVGRRRRLGQHQIAAGAVEPDPAGRRDAERARIGAPEDCLRLVALGDVDQIARQQPVLVESLFVARQAALVFDPAFDEIEDDARQLALGHAVQVFDIDGVFDLHDGIVSLW